MIINRRKIGKESFYYLQHSYRKNGKVITKQKYIGKKLLEEKELEKLKIEIQLEQKHEINKTLETIKNNFQKEWKTIPGSVKEKELQEIAIAFTYNTNAIEGSTITLEETREIIQNNIGPNKPIKEIKETENHSRIFLEILKENKKITKETILNWHREIFEQTKPEIAGKFRDYRVRVGEYIAPDWQDVEKLINEYITFINKKIETNIVEFSAISHYKFEKIHPFGDGNGRIGRLITNQMLWHTGYPMLIITYKKRKAYYAALKKDQYKFVKYFIRSYLTAHKKRYKQQ